MSLATQGIKIGAHYPIPPGGDLLEAINLWESPQHADRRMDLVLHYRKWGAPSGDFTNARISLQQACGAGRAPVITWEPVLADGPTGPYTLKAIGDGAHDTYITGWATGLRDLGRPVYVRFAHEMNGDWYPWAGDPENYVRAWRRITTLFQQAGAANVRMVWCPNTSDQPASNQLENYWPGEQWVDVLGVDGYNNYGGWRSFDRVIRTAYNRLSDLTDSLPMWVCETATAEGNPALWPGTGYWSKPSWVEDLFAADLPRVEAVCWFDTRGGAPQRYDWRADSTGPAINALRRGLRAATGYVPAPGPYVPPVPDRVTAHNDNPGSVTVGWRTIPAFHRGCVVRATSLTGGGVQVTALKPSTTATLTLPVGEYQVTVASYTLVRTSAPSPPVPVTVREAF